ncbi:MAG: SGNH/GDSL hydrolase family protein, partial [Myxococcales bacterium]|nr:SGNH/GDSL hydrolase family protein [Myxococcales bacterium]
LLSTMPTRTLDDDDSTWVARANAIARGVAQARQIPLMDYYQDMNGAPDKGLGGDDVHPNVYNDGGAKACVFTDAALDYGYNIRNLITLEALDRAKRVVVDKEAAPDAAKKARTGQGTFLDPYVMDGFPFTDVRDTTQSTQDAIDMYTGCEASQNESGPEVYYKLTVTENTKIRAYVFDRGNVDVDIHLLKGTATAGACAKRAHQEFTADLTPGTWFFTLDTFVGAMENGGEYLFVVLKE